MGVIQKIIDNIFVKADSPLQGYSNNIGYSILRSNLQTLSDTVFACISRRAIAVASTDQYLMKETSQGSILLPNEHPLNMLFKNPNKVIKESYFALKELAIRWLDENGNAYFYTPRYGGKYPVQIWVLPSTRVRLGISRDGQTEYYFDNGTKTVKLDSQEVIHVKTIKPNSDINKSFYYGQPIILDAITKVIAADDALYEFVTDFFDTQALPPLVLESENEVPQQTFDIFKKQVNEVLRKQPLSLVAEMGSKIVPLNVGSQNSSWVTSNLEESVKKRISSVFLVPYPLLDGQTASYTNYQTALQDFYSMAIEPLNIRLDEAFTTHFRQFEDGIMFEHDRFEFSDPTTNVAKMNLAVSNRVVSENELREFANLPLIDGMDNMIGSSELINNDGANNGDAII